MALAKTDAAGRYVLRGTRPATPVTISAKPCQTNDGIRTSYRVPVTVAAGTTKPGIDIKLALGGKITGRITDTSGRPVAGACVLTYGDEDNYTATTNANGVYTLRGLPTSPYYW